MLETIILLLIGHWVIPENIHTILLTASIFYPLPLSLPSEFPNCIIPPMPLEFHSIPLPCRFSIFSSNPLQIPVWFQNMPNLAYFTSKYFKWLKLLVYFKNKNILWWTCVNRKIFSHTTIECIICYFCHLELFWASFVSSHSQTQNLQNFTWRPQSEDLHVLHWVDKNFMRLFSMGEERMFRGIKASKTWCTIQALLVLLQMSMITSVINGCLSCMLAVSSVHASFVNWLNP